MTTIRRSSQDRTPARRTVPALLSLGLLLWIAWLAVTIVRPDQPQPLPAHPSGPMVITIPRIGVKAGIVGIGLQADGAMQVPDLDKVGWYKRGPRPGTPGPLPAAQLGIGDPSPRQHQPKGSAPQGDTAVHWRQVSPPG